ncbi:MAG TPA: hypothetical protein VLH09_15455 [Bryobacteraceae bacterium]|nr:hypothetical protein [Bryobacteraceae bacterium]
MPLEPYLHAPEKIRQLLLSRRDLLHAGLLPLLALRGSASQLIQNGDPHPALALALEGGSPGGTAISPDGSTAYVAFIEGDIVLVVDLQAGRVRSGVDLTPAGPLVGSNKAVLSADGRLLFIANSGVGNTAIIDTATERLIKVLPFCPSQGDSIKASADGKVYIGLGDGRLIIVSCSDLSFRAVSLGVFLNSIALSPNRANLLYAVSVQDYHLGPQSGRTLFHAFNLDTGREERRATLPAAACAPFGGVMRLQLATSGDVAYLGWNNPDPGIGNLTPFDLSAFQAGASTEIQDGVVDLVVHPENGRVYAVGTWWATVLPGRIDGTMYISEWDPATRKVTRRLPISPSKVMSAIRLDPLNPRFVYTTEVEMGFIRKVDTISGTEYMRVRFYSGKRLPYAAATSGSTAYITGHKTPLIHKLDLDSGKWVGSLDLPGLTGCGIIAYSDGKLFVGASASVIVISAADGSLISSFAAPSGLFLSGLTFFRDRIAAVAGPSGGQPDRMLILDARTFSVLDTFRFELPLQNRIGRVLASPDGSKLYVQQGIYCQRAILQVLDSATLRVLKRIEPPTTAFQGGDGETGAFDEQARIAYLGGFTSVYKVHMDTNEFLGQLDVYDVYKEMGREKGWPASALTGIHLSPAKDRLLITSLDGQCVYQYDLRNQKWIPRAVPVGPFPSATAISPDRKYLYVVNNKSDIVRRLDTTMVEEVDRIPLGGPISELGIDSLRHAASYQHVGAVPGCIMVIRDGRALPGEIGPPFLTLLQLDGSGKVATEIGDTKVLFDGVPAPLLHAYAAQVAVVVPYSVAGKRTVKMQLIYNGEENYPVEFNVRDAMPGIFTMDATGQGQAVMLNENYSLNGPASPAAKGSWVMFYFSGAGQTDPPGVDGEVTGTVLARPRLPVRVWIAGREVEVLYAGAAPGIVSGVMQVNVRLPMDIPSGNNLSVTMTVGPFGPSPDVVTMAIG